MREGLLPVSEPRPLIEYPPGYTLSRDGSRLILSGPDGRITEASLLPERVCYEACALLFGWLAAIHYRRSREEQT